MADRYVFHKAPRNIFQYDAFSIGLAGAKKWIALFEKEHGKIDE